MKRNITLSVLCVFSLGLLLSGCGGPAPVPPTTVSSFPVPSAAPLLTTPRSTESTPLPPPSEAPTASQNLAPPPIRGVTCSNAPTCGEKLVVNGGVELTPKGLRDIAKHGNACPAQTADNPVADDRASDAALAAAKAPTGPATAGDSPPATTLWDAYGLTPIDNRGPADAQVAAGTTHIVITENAAIAFYNKAGQKLWAGKPCNFFEGLGLRSRPYPSESYYDARVIFDEYRSRFWISSHTFNECCNDLGPDAAHDEDIAHRRTKFVIAVSQSENPLDGWYLYWWDAVVHEEACSSVTPANCADPVYKPGDAGDYPSLGMSSCCVLESNPVSSNMRCASSTCPHAYQHVAYASAAAMAQGSSPSAVVGWEWWDWSAPAAGLAGAISGSDQLPTDMMPAVHHGPGDHAYFVSRIGTNQVDVWSIRPNLNSKTGPAVERARITVKRAFPSAVPDSPQKDSCNTLLFNNLGTSPLKAVYRAGKLYLTTQDAEDWLGRGLVTASRLLRLDVSQWPAVPDPGSKDDEIIGAGPPPDDHGGLFSALAVPIVEVNKLGDAAVVFAHGNAKVFPDVYYSAFYHDETSFRRIRRLSPPVSSPEVSYFGDKSNCSTNPAQSQPNQIQWADTGGASVDPYDDTAIWLAQSYGSSQDGRNFKIWVAKVFGKPHPDLFVSDLRVDPPLTETEALGPRPVRLTIGIANQGDGAAVAATVHVELELDGRGAKPIELGKFVQNPLAPGQWAAHSFSGQMPAGLAKGKYQLRVRIDPQEEYSLANNTSVAEQVEIR